MFSSSVSSIDSGGHFGDIGQLGESVDRLLGESGIERLQSAVERSGLHWKSSSD